MNMGTTLRSTPIANTYQTTPWRTGWPCPGLFGSQPFLTPISANHFPDQYLDVYGILDRLDLEVWRSERSKCRGVDQRYLASLACGTAGFSHYMACGGTFFGYTADEDQWATSYDYSAPIGEAGTLRKSYYGIKFAGLFTRSFNHVLGNSVDGGDLIDQPGEKMCAFVNSSQSGNIAFIENNGAAAVDYKLKWKNKSEAVPKSGTLHIAPNQVVPFIADYPLPGKRRDPLHCGEHLVA